jgi:uncharacterized protein (DUF2141 family)
MMMGNLRYLLLPLALVSNAVFAETLIVSVEGVKPGEGNIRIAVFDATLRDEFPEGSYLHSVEVPATTKSMAVEIPNVEPGEYAVAVIQDLNENQKLDRNFLRIPKEPYGFSGKWKSGSSSYDEALFRTEEVGFEIRINLK